MFKGICHRTRTRHIVCNFTLGIIFGLVTSLFTSVENGLITSFILGLLYMIYEYKIYNEINKVNLLSIQFGSILLLYSLELL